MAEMTHLPFVVIAVLVVVTIRVCRGI